MNRFTPARAAAGLAAGVTLLQLTFVALVYWVPPLLPPDIGIEYMRVTRRPLLAVFGVWPYVLATAAAATGAGNLVADGYDPRRVLGLFGLSAVGCGLGFALANGSVATLARPFLVIGRMAAEIGGAVLVASTAGVVVGTRYRESGD